MLSCSFPAVLFFWSLLIVESIIQILLVRPNAKILVCAPSDAACDKPSQKPSKKSVEETKQQAIEEIRRRSRKEPVDLLDAFPFSVGLTSNNDAVPFSVGLTFCLSKVLLFAGYCQLVTPPPVLTIRVQPSSSEDQLSGQLVLICTTKLRNSNWSKRSGDPNKRSGDPAVSIRTPEIAIDDRCNLA